MDTRYFGKRKIMTEKSFVMYNIYEQKTKDSKRVLLASFTQEKYAIQFLRAREEYYLNSNEFFPYKLDFEKDFY